jgi:hypothetical protein
VKRHELLVVRSRQTSLDDRRVIEETGNRRHAVPARVNQAAANAIRSLDGRLERSNAISKKWGGGPVLMSAQYLELGVRVAEPAVGGHRPAARGVG